MEIHELAEKAAHRKAKLIDEHLLKFLAELGIDVTAREDESYSIYLAERIRKELKEKGLELIVEVQKYEASEVYTFKLCKLLSKTGLNIPMPTITF